MRRTSGRRKRLTFAMIALGASLSILLVLRHAQTLAAPESSSGDPYREIFQDAAAALTVMGASSCSSINCHGGGTPRQGETILGDEYDRWFAKGEGAHFKAYKALYDERSQRIAKSLYGPDAVATSQLECLACHSLHVDPGKRGRRFDLEDGISCEACHGPSEKWLSSHLTADWRNKTAEDKARLGMYDTRNLVRRAERCLDCHLGAETRQVTHAMIAAGHPELTFELATDLFKVPRHWRDEVSFVSGTEGSFFHARVWAVGQAVVLREWMRKLEHWADGSPLRGADYAMFDCTSCHHDLRLPSWRQQRQPLGPVGEPSWYAAGWVVCRSLIEVAWPEAWDRFEENIEKLFRTLSIAGTNHKEVRSAAAELRKLSDELARKLAEMAWSEAKIQALLKTIAASHPYVSRLGYRGAEQAFLALYVLSQVALGKEGEPSAEGAASRKLLARLHDSLYDQSENPTPERFDAAAFGELMRDFQKLLDR